MLDGYSSPDFDSIDDALDELLCEYVDGTMDPTVREAFEEYLAANPDLANHAECLCQTRERLTQYRCRHMRETLHLEIRERVARELKRKDRSVQLVNSRLGNAAMITSAVSLMLILGMMIGVTAVQQMQVEGSMTTGYVDAEPERSSLAASDAHAHTTMAGGAMPLEWMDTTPRTPAVFTPVSSLSGLSQTGRMTPFHFSVFAADSLQGRRLVRTSAP